MPVTGSRNTTGARVGAAVGAAIGVASGVASGISTDVIGSMTDVSMGMSSGAITSAIGALKGPLHGGANEAVFHILEKIDSSGVDPVEYVRQMLAQKKSRSPRSRDAATPPAAASAVTSTVRRVGPADGVFFPTTRQRDRARNGTAT